MALVRTDYGLIYNDDGSLCATLLPEGGVAVEKGITNLLTEAQSIITDIEASGWTGNGVTVSKDESIYLFGNGSIKGVATSSGSGRGFYTHPSGRPTVTAGEIYTYSFYVRTNIATTARIALTWRDSEGNIILAELANTKNITANTWERVSLTGVAPEGAVVASLGAYAVLDTGDTIWCDGFSFKQLPYLDSFNVGNRLSGRLPYPSSIIPKREGVIAFKATCAAIALSPTKWRHIWDTTGLRFALVWNGLGTNEVLEVRRNDITILALAKPQGFDETLEHMYVVNYSTTMTELWVDGEMWGRTEGDFGELTPGDTWVLGARYTIAGYELGGYIKNLLIKQPHTVSPETVKAWHSLDAPFFDPREISTAQLAAEEYAKAQAELARITAEAYADGVVTAEEQARIAEATANLNTAKEYAEYLETIPIDAGARQIHAPGVIIDETGAWGIANGVKQAGFGTDGKWMAGGGSVVADEDGQRFINKTTGEIVIDFQSQTGKGIFRGDLVSDKVRLSKFMGYKVESSPDFITTIDGVSLTGNYPSCAFQPNFSICVASLNGNQRAQAILLSAVRYLPFSSSGIVVDTNAGYKDLVSVCFDSAKFNYHFLIVESGDLSTPLIWTTANDTLTSISQIARFNADVCWGLRTDCDNTHIYGTYIYNPTTNSYGDLKLIKLNIATKNIVSTKTLVTGRHISSCIKYYNNYLYIGYSNYDTGQVYLLKADTSGNIITEPVAIPGFYIWNFDISIDPQTGLVNVVSNRPGVGFRHGLVDLNFNPIYKPSFKTGKAGQEISAISTCRTVNGIFVVGDVYGSSLENPSPLVSSSLIPISNEDVSIHDIFALMLP